MPDKAALVGAARRLLPPGVAVGSAPLAVLHPLMPGEVIGGATVQRLREFSAGRAAARDALRQLGIGAVALPAGADRAPIWPEGIVGSISHSARACLAIAAPSAAFVGLGVDLEDDSPLERDLWDDVLVPEEQLWLARQPEAGRGRLAKLMFSAKEAAYKAQYAQSRTLFGFDGMALTMRADGFVARFRHVVAPFGEGQALQGRFAHVPGHVLTVACLPA